MEPTVKEKKKQLYLLSLESSWSFFLPIPGLMEGKEAHILNLTKEEPSKGEDPRSFQDSPARGSPAASYLEKKAKDD